MQQTNGPSGEVSAARLNSAIANATQSSVEQVESNWAMQNQHRLTILASAGDNYPKTALPMSLPLPHPLGKCPPLTAAE
jgi:hypothetical protein